MNILVTGATGFIGSHLVPELLKNNHKVTIFTREDSDTSALPASRIVVKQGSFSSEEDVASVLKGIDAVIHLVGTWNTWGKSSRDIWNINVFPLQQIIRYTPKTIKQILFLSSAHVYDLTQPSPISETDKTKLWNQYVSSKLDAERILKESTRPHTIFRPGIVYGEGDVKGFVANLIKTAQGRFVFIPGSGNNFIHPVHINDLVAAIISAIGRKPANEIMNIAGPEPVTLNDLVNNIISLSQSPAQKLHVPKFLLPLAINIFKYFPSSKEPLVTPDRVHISSASRTFDCSLAQRLISFSPAVKIQDELSNVINATLKEKTPLRNILATPLGIIQKAAERIQTPFFVFDEQVLIHNYQKLFRAVTAHYPTATIYYSAKTNYEPAVLSALRQLGSSLEIACGHELMAGTLAGVHGREMCFDGPVKTKQDLEYALDHDVFIYNLDSYEAAEELNALAQSRNKIVNVGYRINLGMKGFLKGPAEAYITKFGIELQDAPALYLKTKKLPHLKITGIHTHIGSQITDPSLYERSIKQLIALAHELERNGIPIEEINIGGGIPSPNLTKTTIIDLAASVLPFMKGIIKFLPRKHVPSIETYGEIIGKTFAYESKILKHPARLCLEPGRSLVSSMGILVSRVSHIKGRWIFLDASTYSVPESIFFARRRFLVPEKIALKRLSEYSLAGASLNTADIFSNQEQLPVMDPGDIVLILDAGAYSVSRATQFTILNPPVYMLKNNECLQLIKEKGTYESALAQTYQGTTRISLE